MKNIRNKAWGISLIILGIITALNSMNIVNINFFFEGWLTLFIIIPCFISLFTDDDKITNLVGVVVGVILLLDYQNVVNFDFILKLILPAVFITFGLSFIYKDKTEEIVIPKVKNETEYSSIFSYQKITKSGKEFIGCDIDAIFGGLQLDLSNVKIKNNSVIISNSIFGKSTITVPDNINVIIKSTTIFGSIINKVKTDSKSKVTLYIDGTALFGGIEINEYSNKKSN